MTPVSSTGSSFISSCLNCEKVVSLADELTKSMQEFEVFTMEMEFDPKSAKSKSTQILSNFWQLISAIKSLKIQEKDKDKVFDNQTDMCENFNPMQSSSKSNFVFDGKKNHKSIVNEENEREIEPLNSESKLKSDSVDKMKKKRGLRESTPNLKPNPNPNPLPTSKRLNEIKRAKTLLRTIKCETPQGFYNFHECLKCQRQFNNLYAGLRHVQNLHMNVGTKCINCSHTFFTKPSLELHISKCSKQKQFNQIKVWLSNESKNPVKVNLRPHEKQKQQQTHTPSTRNRKQKSSKMIQNQGGKQTKVFDPLKIKVRNPFENFSLKQTLAVRVLIERIKMENEKEISTISRVPASENIENEKENEKKKQQ